VVLGPGFGIFRAKKKVFKREIPRQQLLPDIPCLFSELIGITLPFSRVILI
jgi:hypothetical protein